MIPKPFEKALCFEMEAKDLIKRVLHETAEDLEVLVDILKKEGIVVKRTKSVGHGHLKNITLEDLKLNF